VEEHHQENTIAKNIMKNSKMQTNPTTTWQNLMMTFTYMIIRKIRFIKTPNSMTMDAQNHLFGLNPNHA